MPLPIKTVTLGPEQSLAPDAVPLTFTDPFQPATPDAPETVPCAHLDWPEISTVPADLIDDDGCPWKQTGFL